MATKQAMFIVTHKTSKIKSFDIFLRSSLCTPVCFMIPCLVNFAYFSKKQYAIKIVKYNYK